MREILFRGKSLITDEWVYGYYGVTIMGNHYINNGRNNINTHTSIDFKTLGQYTGLNDKNGFKIFDGDLLEDNYTDDDYNVVESNIVVVWDDITACWSVDNSFFQDGSSKANLVEYLGIENLLIVGNIHDKL